MIKSLIPVICPSVESSRSPSRRRGGSPTTVIITGVRGAWIWPGCSSWSERSSTFGPSLQAHLVAQATPTCALANGSCRRPPHPSSETSRTIPSRNKERWRNSPPGGWAPGLRHPLASPRPPEGTRSCFLRQHLQAPSDIGGSGGGRGGGGTKGAVTVAGTILIPIYRTVGDIVLRVGVFVAFWAGWWSAKIL